MQVRDPRVRRGFERGRRIGLEVAERLRIARRAAGISQAAVGRAIATSQARISRIELGRAAIDVSTLSMYAAVVGLDLAVMLYPGGAPLRDAAHIRLLARLQALLPARFRWRTEIPIPMKRDQRAIDAAIIDPRIDVGFELETRLLIAEAVCRRVTLKQRDAGIAVMILVLADTAANRAAVLSAEATLRGTFPLSAREVLSSLRAGRTPAGNGIIFA